MFGAARIGYAVAAKGISVLASSGDAASAGRETLKRVARLVFGKGWRPPNLAGKSDAALRAFAGRTNPYVNAYGAGIATTAVQGAGIVSECKCPRIGSCDEQLSDSCPTTGKMLGFEIENAFIALRTVARLLREVDGVRDLKRRPLFSGSDGVHIEFWFRDASCVVQEPFGDNSRYMIGQLEAAVPVDLGDLEKRSQPTPPQRLGVCSRICCRAFSFGRANEDQGRVLVRPLR